jgi:hypothetical protein
VIPIVRLTPITETRLQLELKCGHVTYRPRKQRRGQEDRWPQAVRKCRDCQTYAYLKSLEAEYPGITISGGYYPSPPQERA